LDYILLVLARAHARLRAHPPELEHIPKTLMKVIQDKLSKKFDSANFKANHNIPRKNKNQNDSCQGRNQSKA